MKRQICASKNPDMRTKLKFFGVHFLTEIPVPSEDRERRGLSPLSLEAVFGHWAFIT